MDLVSLTASAWIPWALASIALIVFEILTQAFVALALAAGCLAAACLASLGATWAVGGFTFATLLFLVTVRPILLSRWLAPRGSATNTDALVGMTARVIVAIEPGRDEGRVRVQGEDWWAVTPDGSSVALDSLVRVQAIDSSRLVVVPES